jgi:hypothetical protein
MTKAMTLQPIVEMEAKKSSFYPGRVVYGTEPLVQDLQCHFGNQLLTASGCLVAPLIRPGRLPATNEGDSQAQRLVNRLGRNAYDLPFDTYLGSSYLAGHYENPSLLRVQANIGRNALKYFRKESELINAFLARLKENKRGLDPTVLATSYPLPKADAYLLAEELQKYEGTPVTLSAPCELEYTPQPD